VGEATNPAPWIGKTNLTKQSQTITRPSEPLGEGQNNPPTSGSHAVSYKINDAADDVGTIDEEKLTEEPEINT